MAIKRVTFTEPPAKAKATTKRQRRAAKKALQAKLSAIGTMPKVGSNFVSDDKLNFELLVQRGSDLLMELHRLEANPKLSAAGFVKQALALSGKDEAQLRELDAKIARGPATDAIASFCRKLSRALSERNFPSLPINRLTKVLWLYGSEDVLPQAGIIGATLGDLFAVSTLHAVERWPERFGTVDDPAAYISKCQTLRTRIAKICDLMREKIQPADLLQETRSLTPNQRREGLMRQRIRRHPGVLYAADVWPAEVLERELLASGGRPQPEPAPEPAPHSGPMDPIAKAQLLRQATTAVVIPMASATM